MFTALNLKVKLLIAFLCVGIIPFAIIATVALATTALVSLLGRGWFKLIPILCGIAAGYAASLLLDMIGFSASAHMWMNLTVAVDELDLPDVPVTVRRTVLNPMFWTTHIPRSRGNTPSSRLMSTGAPIARVIACAISSARAR